MTSPCVLLLHVTSDESHFDLMIKQGERLWTARIGLASKDWKGTFPLTVLAPHRKEYLTFEGEISGNRGSVKRVDEGTARILVWNETLIEAEMQLKEFQGRLKMTRLRKDEWQAHALEKEPRA